MTNLEYIRTLNLEELVEMLLSEDCPYCIHRFDCRGDLNCNEGILAWLKQEHEEPPKLVNANEIVKGIERAVYCKPAYCDLVTYGVSDCEGRECVVAIKNYIKTIEGVSNG